MGDLASTDAPDTQREETLKVVLPPILVIGRAADEEEDDGDETLFEPQSPRSSRASSVGTPPSPRHKKFEWPTPRNGLAEGSRREESVSPVESVDVAHVSLDGQGNTVSADIEDGDYDEQVVTDRYSTSTTAHQLNLDAIDEKEPNPDVVGPQRDPVSRFQLKGGLVGWLHGDVGHPNGRLAVVGSSTQTFSHHAASIPPKKRSSSLFTNLYDKMKQKHEELEFKLQLLDGPAPAADTSRPLELRRTLQPSSGSFAHGVLIGFDDFVSVSSEPQPPQASAFRRHNRLRSVSSGEECNSSIPKPSTVRSRLRSLSFATCSSKPPRTDGENDPQPVLPSALQWDALPVEDCLADPKLAAEFINTVMPGDEWLLTLLYSIEEYETLTTPAPALTSTPMKESQPPLVVQITMATAIVHRFLGNEGCAKYNDLEKLGKEIRAVVSQYQTADASHGEDVASMVASQGATLSRNLFDGVYTFVFDKLRDAYDSKFRLTREYTYLVMQKKQQLQLGVGKSLQHLVLTFDQVIESEWCCTVFWVYLFRTAHHHRLSFIMDVKFKLRRVHLAAQEAPVDSPEAARALHLLQHDIFLICRKFLSSKLAALALPTTSPMLMRLKDELCRDADGLMQSSPPSIAVVQQMVEKLDAMRAQTRVEFKRMSIERFASFRTSTLYRDFILHPNSATSAEYTRADDLTQLLRINRIPFHQTAVTPPNRAHLRDLLTKAKDAVFDKAIATVFAFRRTNDVDQRFFCKSLYSSPLEGANCLKNLQKTVECFLLPEDTRSPFAIAQVAKLPPMCFSFLAGTGESTVYGCVWRCGIVQDQTVEVQGGVGTKSVENVHGVCVVSRYPFIDGLREYSRSLAMTINLETTEAWSTLNSSTQISQSMVQARLAFEAHCACLQEASSKLSAPLLDTSLQDMFDCLSITHIMRLFSLILQEKKIVVVSSSYSVLLSVGEALRAIIEPLVWSHIYVPVLPVAMKGYLQCPTPFIFGLHTSYARHCELPTPSNDLAVVNLDRDSVTGGGDVYLPPLRAKSLRDKLLVWSKPRLCTRDKVGFTRSQNSSAVFPSDELRRVFREELVDIARHLETFAFRFECADRTVAVVDTSNTSRQWPADAARFYSAVLHSQAFSTYLGADPHLPRP